MTTFMRLRELTHLVVQKSMCERSILLVDVREPQEYAAERIHVAPLFALSTFDPAALPRPEGCPVPFHCGSAERLATAVARRLERGIGHASHMAVGIQAWKAGLPGVTLDPASGSVVDRR